MDEIIELKKEIVQYLKANYNSLIKNNKISLIVDTIIAQFLVYLISKKIYKSSSFKGVIQININNIDNSEIVNKIINESSYIEDILSKFCTFPNELTFNLISSFYEKMKSYFIQLDSIEIAFTDSERKSSSIFYTPKDIAQYIVDKSFEALNKKINTLIDEFKFKEAMELLNHIRVIDISCGTGIFLVKTLEKFTELIENIIKKQFLYQNININSSEEIKRIVSLNLKNILFNSIFGVDIDKNAVLLSKYLLLNQLYDYNRDPSFKELVAPQNINDIAIISGDSILSYIEPENIDIIKQYFSNRSDIFCYKNTFQHVFNRKNPGFDIVLMNPPYGKVRIESNKGIYKQKIAIGKEKEPLKVFSDFIRNSKQFPLSSCGVLNYYKLMIERAIQILRTDGVLGCIIPNTILCDLSTINLRKFLCDNMNTRYIVNIPEKSIYFPNVTQAFSIVISTKGHKTELIKFKDKVMKATDLDNNAYIDLDLNIIRKIFPQNYNIPITDKTGLEIFYKLHKYPTLSEIPFLINARGEADLTLYKKYISSIPESNTSKLVRGIHIEKFRLNEDISKPSFINKEAFLIALGESKKIEEIKRGRIICKQITNQNSQERITFAYVPPNTILANSCNYITFNEKYKEEPEKLLKYLLGLLNSSILEWRFRITSTNNHVNNYELDDLPIAIPSSKSENYKDFEEIVNIVNMIKGNNINQTSDFLTEIDKIIARIYEINASELDYIYLLLKNNFKH